MCPCFPALQVAAEIEARAAAEAVRLEEEARKAQEAAAKYSRQQKAMEEKIAKTAEEAQRQKEEKEALQVGGGSEGDEGCHATTALLLNGCRCCRW